MVEAKEKQVGLLEELKASTISEAVTGRIDVRTGQPYPAYKPTCIEWLGSIPVHWELVRLMKRQCFGSVQALENAPEQTEQWG